MMSERKTRRGRAKRLLAPVLAMGTVAGGTLAVTTAPAEALTANVGYACSYWANIRLGTSGQFKTQGCTPQSSRDATPDSLAPSRTLPANGAFLETIDSNGVFSKFGPAIMHSSPYDQADNLTNSGEHRASTGGGNVGTPTVTSTARAEAVGPSPFWTMTATSWDPPGENWNPDNSMGYVKAQCTAGPNGATGHTVEIKNGRVDTTLDGDGYPLTWVDVPFNPSPNYEVPYVISNTPMQDHGIVRFNERINHADGSFTVYAMHMILQGPFAWGDVYIGQVKCGHV